MSGPSRQCDRCGGAICSLRFDRVFYCPSCRLAVEWRGEGGMRFSPVVFAEACARLTGELVHLPIWRFELASPSPPPERAKFPWRWVFVPAFSMSGVTPEADIGLLYTQSQVETSSRSADLPLPGGRRTSSEAEVLIPLIILTVFDRAGTTGLDLDYHVEECVLMAAPFFVDGLRLTDGLLGRTIDSSLVTDLSEIKRRIRETMEQ